MGQVIRATYSPTDKPHSSLQKIEKIVAQIPQATAIEIRDRALVAFVAITGIRGGALNSLKLIHIDIERKLILQNPLEVTTNFSKQIDTFQFPLNKLFKQIYLDWVAYLQQERLFTDHDPILHEGAQVSLNSYDKLSLHEQGDLIRVHGTNVDEPPLIRRPNAQAPWPLLALFCHTLGVAS
jgi:hypothetical protein